MNLYEYEAKRLFQEFGIPVPPSVLVTKPEELRKVHFGYPLTLKCQVLSGGRGKAGGIKFPKDLKDAENTAKDLLKLTIGGSKTKAVLVEPMMNIASELYLSVTLDRGRGCPIFIASAEGGIEIESSENVITMPIEFPYNPYQGRKLAKMLGLKGAVLNRVADIANRLYKLFKDRDLDLAEINPLVITGGEDVVALDGKVIINDDSLDRQRAFDGWQETHMSDLSDLERRAKVHGLNLVELDGNIGLLCNGAGLTMATMDMVKKFGGNPGNFLDAGGGSDQAKTLAALEIVHENPKVEVILLNILGGITACDEVAGALVSFMERHPERSMIVRLRGNNQDKAEQILAKSGLKLYPEIEDAVKAAVEKSKTKEKVASR